MRRRKIKFSKPRKKEEASIVAEAVVGIKLFKKIS